MKKANRKEPKVNKKKTEESGAPKKVTTGYFFTPFFITLIALAVETCLVFNEKTGVVGKLIYNVFIGSFGIAGYFIPAGALVIAFFFNSIVENKTVVYKCVMLALFSAFLSAINSLLSLENLAGLPISIPDYFVKGYSGEGGGAVGGLVGKLMSVAFGNVFSVILSIVVCIISISLFIGTTKAGLWYYLKEMRMFGAEKTAVVKAPKKAPEKISSKETEGSGAEPKSVGSELRTGSTPLLNGVNTPTASLNLPSDPFRFGSEVGQRSPRRQSASIDLRAKEEKSEEIKDIYSEEAEETREIPDIRIAQPTVQFPAKNGRAYSPFADPFIKREEFMRSGGAGEAHTAETPSTPSRAYSPFADPFTKRDEFIRRGNAAANGVYKPAEVSVAESTRPSAGYGAVSSPGAVGAQISNPIANVQYKTGQANEIPRDTRINAESSAFDRPSASFDGGESAGVEEGNASAPTVKNNDNVASWETSKNTDNGASWETAKNNDNGASWETAKSADDGALWEAAKKTEGVAPWDVAVKTAAPFTASVNSPYLSDDDYTEDTLDGEDEENGGFVKQENIPVFSTSSFTSSYADRYGSEKNNAEQSLKSEAEKAAYRDHTKKLYPNYVYPSSVLLEQRSAETTVTEDDVIEVRNKLLGKLASFKIEASLVGYSAGPSITRYELAPGPGVTVKAITNRIEDIALELQSDGVRIATVPGKSVIGIEVPNKKVSVVSLRSLIENRDFMESKSKITVCVGLTVTGRPIYMDIDDMPHVLIAGQTKSGKSVAINCMLLSLLYRTTPDEVQLILIDPKRVELNIYSKVPHLAMPVIDDPQRAAAALRWAVCEMERRYEMMDNLGVRNRDEYYELKEQDPTLEYLPQIVIVIDELADLMLQVREHVETLINRLAAKARACGIHLLVGTQRPSVDIVTGLIKANIPARISFQVSSSADSRIILGAVGAEKLLGRGDMLYQATGAGRVRVQGAFVSSAEIKRVTKFIIDNNGEAEFDPEVMRQLDVETDKINKTSKKATAEDSDSGSYVDSSEADFEYICKAMEYVFESGVTTTNNIQRRLRIGFNRAADIVDALENLGFISRRNGSKPRDILIDPETFEQWKIRNAP